MGLLQRLKDRQLESAAMKWGKYCVRVTVFSVSALKHQYAGTSQTYAWLGGRALLLRNHWRQVAEREFLFEKSGESLEIEPDWNILRVIHGIVDIEYKYDLNKLGLPSWDCDRLLLLAHAGVDKEMES